jgi:hypothetical protein
MTMRIASYEYFDKYKSSSRIKTNPGIDMDVPVLFGRTIKEWLFSMGTFITFAALDKPFSGAILFCLLFFFAPFYRNKIDPGFFSHITWSLGKRKKFFLKKGAPSFFSYKKYVVIFGP